MVTPSTGNRFLRRCFLVASVVAPLLAACDGGFHGFAPYVGGGGAGGAVAATTTGTHTGTGGAPLDGGGDG